MYNWFSLLSMFTVDNIFQQTPFTNSTNSKPVSVVLAFINSIKLNKEYPVSTPRKAVCLLVYENYILYNLSTNRITLDWNILNVSLVRQEVNWNCRLQVMQSN